MLEQKEENLHDSLHSNAKIVAMSVVECLLGMLSACFLTIIECRSVMLSVV